MGGPSQQKHTKEEMGDNSSCLPSRSLAVKETMKEREEQLLGIHYEHQHTLPPPLSDPSNNHRTATPRPTTSGVEAWIDTWHVAV